MAATDQPKTVKSVIAHAEALLETAAHGLDDIRRPGRARSGAQTAVMAARSITWTLQNLKNLVSGFDDWWSAKASEMGGDPTMRSMVRVRNALEKQGASVTSSIVSIPIFSHFDMARITSENPPPTDGCSFFVGDQSGGCGWQTPDGRKYYVPFPSDTFTIELAFKDIFLEEGVPTKEAAGLLAEYLTYLENLVAEARSKFV